MGCCIYIGCGLTTPTACIASCGCRPSIVTSKGGYTPQQLACGLPGQCKCGPGGAAGFPGCSSGPSLCIKKCQVQSSATDKVLGGIHAAGASVNDAASSAWCTIKKDFAKLPGITTILIVLFVMMAILVFVYGYAKSR